MTEEAATKQKPIGKMLREIVCSYSWRRLRQKMLESARERPGGRGKRLNEKTLSQGAWFIFQLIHNLNKSCCLVWQEPRPCQHIRARNCVCVRACGVDTRRYAHSSLYAFSSRFADNFIGMLVFAFSARLAPLASTRSTQFIIFFDLRHPSLQKQFPTVSAKCSVALL